MAGIGGVVALEELYLSQNGITRIEDLGSLTQLSVLDLASNRVEQVR
jgi:Leucine-rich repeat (LRR) protein